MPLRTRLFAASLARLPSIVDVKPDQIPQLRQFVAPRNRLTRLITGEIPADVRITQHVFSARDGEEAPVRLYQPPTRTLLPVVVFYHGGGWVLGNPRQYDPLCGFIAQQTPALVVAVDYRKAPEHRAPIAVRDAIDALRWAHQHADRFDGDASRLAVCGDSAGGNLAAVVCHQAHDDGGPRIAHQALMYPATDATMSFPSIRDNAQGPVLTAADIRAFLDHYLGDTSPDDPVISPYWRADLTGLPPALIQTADLDPLRDEGLAYADRLCQAGVHTRTTNYVGTVHGFMSFPGATVVAEQARDELVGQLRRHLGDGAVTKAG